MKPQPITSVKARLGEGPFWHDNALYWVDILSKKIHRYFPQEDKTEEMQLDQYIGTLTPIANPEADKSNNRFNDGKCDAKGRFRAGTMAYDPKTAKLLHKIDLPASQVSSCAFGGPNLDILYITTANVDLITEEPLAGRLFKIKLDIKGFPTNSSAD